MKRLIYIAVLVLSVSVVACGKGKQVAPNSGLPPGSTGPYPSPGTSPTPYPSPGSSPTATPPPAPPDLAGGANAQLIIAGSTDAERKALLQNYQGSPINNPGPVMVNVNTAANSGVYLGKLRIRYYDVQYNNLVLHDGQFENGTHIDRGNNVHIKTTDSVTGAEVYRIMFEDRWGAVIIVLQPYVAATPYGTDPIPMTGKVWFRNFNSSAPNPLYNSYCDPYSGYCWPANPAAYCWAGIITSGPYDCRNMGVPPSITGSKAFTFLGTIPYIDGRLALGL